MAFEIEQKFPVSDPDSLRDRLTAAGTQWSEPVVQVDQYFRHPARNFVKTDEALRIRSVDDWNGITYKGPKIDAVTKTRREIEVPLAPGPAAAEALTELLQAVGFAPVREVRKTRHVGKITWENRSIEIALDHVDTLGWFIELEIVAEAPQLDAFRESLLRLADYLELEDPERRGYLDLLLSRERRPPT